ncbi:MAG: phosphatidylserine decarboxylase [Clostridiales bacterium]|nr:phosphatidylserine decarboxylase [Clostridiales bacterium]
MAYADRSGNTYEHDDLQDRVLKYLYGSMPGRVLIKQLAKPWVSKLAQILLSSGLSRIFIPFFIKWKKIDMKDYENKKYTSFNDFFIRKIIRSRRIIDQSPNHFISPCDGKLSVYPIGRDTRFMVKNTSYTLRSLLRNRNLADHYEDGTLLVFRLSVDDYHRYCYIDSGMKSKNFRIKGVFHTVNPIAHETVPVFKENTREYTILSSRNFGRLLVMEVGALLVGKIVNYHEKAYVMRGEEKGRFEFGGSTIIVCIEKGRVIIDNDIMENSMKGIETKVKMGEKIGAAI